MLARLAPLALVVVLLLAGCGRKVSDRLTGRWAVDYEKTAATLELPKDATASADPKDAIGMMRGIFGDMQLEFDGDQLRLTAKGETQAARWQIKSEQDGKLIITTTASGKEARSRDLEVTMEGDLLRLGMGKQQLVFRRAKGPAADPAPSAAPAGGDAKP